MNPFDAVPWPRRPPAPGILAKWLLVAAWSSALAGATAAEPWTLERVLERVRRSDPAVLAAHATRDAARATANRGIAALSPRVTLGAGLTRSDDPVQRFSQKLWQGRFAAPDLALATLNQPPAATAYQWSMVVEQPLWNAGDEITAPGLAAHRRRAADAAERAAVADRLMLAVERYAAAVRAAATEAADSAALAAAEGYRDAAADRLRTGQVSPLDSMRAVARAGEARLRLLVAREASRVALAGLGASLAATVAIDSLAALPEIPAPSSSAPTGAHPELAAAREEARARGVESKRAGFALLPSLNSRFIVSGYRDAAVPGWERRWTAALALELPLWDGTRRLQDWKAGRARARAARASAEALERELAVTRASAEADAALALERRAVARTTAAAAEEARRLAAARYRAGLLALTDLLATDAEASRAREAQVDAEAGALVGHYRSLWARGELR